MNASLVLQQVIRSSHGRFCVGWMQRPLTIGRHARVLPLSRAKEHILVTNRLNGLQFKVKSRIWNPKLYLNVSRRSLLTLIGSSLLSACTQVPKPPIEATAIDMPPVGPVIAPPEEDAIGPDYAKLYAAVGDGGYSVPATPYLSVNPNCCARKSPM